MNDKVLISVVIPIYNAEKYLSDCIDSILEQNINCYEIILVDDGSFDNSSGICDYYKDKSTKIKVIHKQNEGVSIARKIGVENASGDYIVFVDADDKLLANCLCKILSLIASCHPDVIFYGFIKDKKNKKIIAQVTNENIFLLKDEIRKKFFDKLIHDNNMSCFTGSLWGKAIKRDLVKQYLITDSKAVIGEDTASIIPILYAANSVFLIKDCYYWYRYNDDSVTKSNKCYNWECPKVINQHIEKNVNIEYGDFCNQITRKIVHDVFTVVISRFNQNISTKKIFEEIRNHLKETYYSNALKRFCMTLNYKAIIMALVLKYRLLWLGYIYSKIKKFKTMF